MIWKVTVTSCIILLSAISEEHDKTRITLEQDCYEKIFITPATIALNNVSSVHDLEGGQVTTAGNSINIA